MLESKKSEQTAGDNSQQYQARRDININKTEINYNNSISALEHLVKLYKQELGTSSDPQFVGYIKKLEHYTNKISGEIRDLPTKLTEAGFQNDIDWALQLKEQYAKLLQEQKFLKSSQHIHAYILAKIIVLFKNHVLSTIRSGASHEVVKDVLYEKVIKTVEIEIAGNNDILGFYPDDLNGMIYYLTGNCHLVWK